MLRRFRASRTTRCDGCRDRAPTMLCEEDVRICRACHADAMARWRLEDAEDERAELAIEAAGASVPMRVAA